MTFRRSDILPQHASLSEDEFLFKINKPAQPTARKIIESAIPTVSVISDVASDNSLFVESPRPIYIQKPTACVKLHSNSLADPITRNLASVSKNRVKSYSVISKKNGDCIQRKKSAAQKKSLEELKTCCNAGCACNENYEAELEIQSEQNTIPKYYYHQLLIPRLNKKCHKKQQNAGEDTNFCNKARNPLVNEQLSLNRNFSTAHTNVGLEAGMSESDSEEKSSENGRSGSLTGSENFSSPKRVETCKSGEKKLSVSKICQNTCQRHDKHSTDDSDNIRSQGSSGKKRSTKNNPKSYATSNKKSTKCCKHCAQEPEACSNLPAISHGSSPVADRPAKNMQVCIPSDQLYDIWEYLKKQDEKLNSIQEQVALQNTAYLTPDKNPQNAIEAAPQSDSKEVVPNYRNNSLTENSQLIDVLKFYSEQNQILQVQNQKLQEQNQKLQEQMNMILVKVNGPNPVTTNGPESDTSPTHGTESVGLSSKGEGTVEKVVCHKQIEVTKTSTSTMTSLICDGGDKVTYQKCTVVTKSTEELSAHCAYNKNDVAIPSEQIPEGKTPPNSNGKCHLKCSPCCHLKKKQVSSPSPCGDRKVKSPHQGSKSEKQKNEGSDIEPKNLLPTHEGVLRNVNELNTDSGNKEHRKLSSAKKVVPKSSSRRSRKSEKPATPPKEIDSSPVSEKCSKNRMNKKRTSSGSSNTSADSPTYFPGRKKYEDSETDSDSSKVNENLSDSSTVSRYGISSKNLSNGTKKYLESYKLVGKKKSSKNVLLYGRYPR